MSELIALGGMTGTMLMLAHCVGMFGAGCLALTGSRFWFLVAFGFAFPLVHLSDICN